MNLILNSGKYTSEDINIQSAERYRFGQQVRKVRKASGESQEDLAITIRATKASISKIENGTSTSLGLLCRIAAHYKLTITISPSGQLSDRGLIEAAQNAVALLDAALKNLK